jgi:ArsR family transcriptional regulator, zinc-responsive transcriptional repressor
MADVTNRVPDLEQLTNLMKLLSDPTRLQILLMLANGERNVSSICDELKLPQPTVSHHLGLLRLSNVINNRRAGKQIFYTINGRLEGLAGGELSLLGQNFTVRIAPRGSAGYLTA